MELFQLAIILVVYWWLIHHLTCKRIPGPGPTMRRWLSHAIHASARLGFHHGFKNQYDRRGLLHALAHVLTILMLIITLNALVHIAAHSWASIALWWGITLGYWLILTRWQRLKEHKRHLPSRRRWRHIER